MTELRDLLRSADPAARAPYSTSARRQVVIDRAMRASTPARRRSPLLWLAPAAIIALIVAGLGVVTHKTDPAQSANAQTWEMTVTTSRSRSMGDTVSDPRPEISRRWWTRWDEPSYLEYETEDVKGRREKAYQEWGPLNVGTSGVPNVIPDYARRVLPADPLQAVTQLRDTHKEYWASGGTLPSSSKQWLTTARTLITALESGPAWQGEDVDRWWQLFQAVPGVERAGTAADERGGEGELWEITSKDQWIRVVKAHNAQDIAVVSYRLVSEDKQTMVRESRQVFGAPRKVDGVPQEVRDRAQKGG